MVITSLSKELVVQKAVQHMTANNYQVISESETMLVFEDGKDIKTSWLVLGVLFFLIGAILYYLLAKKHTITLTINETDSGTEVQSTTNTTEAMRVSNNFLRTL